VNGPAPTPYTKTVASTVGSGSVRGEVGDRENDLLQSEAPNVVPPWAWGTNVTAAANTTDVSDPYGTNRATKVVYTGGGAAGAFELSQVIGTSAGYEFNGMGFWARTASGTCNIRITEAASNGFSPDITLTTTWQWISRSAGSAGLGRTVDFDIYRTSGDSSARTYYIAFPQGITSLRRFGRYQQTTGAAFALPKIREVAFVAQNLATFSEQLDDASWSNTNVVATPNQIANPMDGALTADLIAETSAAGAVHTNFPLLSGAVAGTVMTLTAYFKDNTRRWAGLRCGVLVGQEATFDLQNGTVSNQFNVLSATIIAVGNGWYRCKISFVMDASGTMSVQAPFLSNTGGAYTAYNGDTTKSVYAWGVQLTVSPSTVPYVKTTNSPVGAGLAERGAVG
jgi:hypothetical protein